MGYTNVALKDKIMELYPEIEKNGILAGVQYSEEKNAYVINFSRGDHKLSTHLEKKDADECMDGSKCIYLGGQIGQLLQNFVGDRPTASKLNVMECCGVCACLDEEGYLVNFGDWDEKIAAGLARQEGIGELTGEQIDILRFVRRHYGQYNYFPVIHSICRNLHQPKDCLTEQFLSPAVVWKIAGLPKPDVVLRNLLEHDEPPT